MSIATSDVDYIRVQECLLSEIPKDVLPDKFYQELQRRKFSDKCKINFIDIVNKAKQVLGDNSENQLLRFYVNPALHAVENVWNIPESRQRHHENLIAMHLISAYIEFSPSAASASLLLERLKFHLSIPLDDSEKRSFKGQSLNPEDRFYYPTPSDCLTLLCDHHLDQPNVLECVSEIFQGCYNQVIEHTQSSDLLHANNSTVMAIGHNQDEFEKCLIAKHAQGSFDYLWFKTVIALYPHFFNDDWFNYVNRKIVAENSNNNLNNSPSIQVLASYVEYTHQLIEDLADQFPESASKLSNILSNIRLKGSRWLKLGLKIMEKHGIKSCGHITTYDNAISRLLGIKELSSDENNQTLIESLRQYDEKLLLTVLPFAGYARNSVLIALGWEDILPLQKQLFINCKSVPETTRSVSDVYNCSSENSGVINREATQQAISLAPTKKITIYLDAIRNGPLVDIEGQITLIEAVMGINRAKIEKKLVRHGQTAIKAYGLYPVENPDELKARYLKFKSLYKEASRYGAERQENTQAAVKAGLKNLAQSAGFADEIRLEWAMEADIASSMIKFNENVEVEGWSITLQLVGILPKIIISKNEKLLKSVPTKVRQSVIYKNMRDAQDTLRSQASRFRQTLENMMCDSEALTEHELNTLKRLPVTKAMLEQLILKSGDVFGLYCGDSLVDIDGNKNVLGTPVIAHVQDLYKANQLSAWQKHIVGKRIVQPFKQAFRELYVVTPAEQKSQFSSRRFAGHQVNGAVTSRLFQARKWQQYSGDIVEVFKNFKRHNLVVQIEFSEAGHYLAECESVTLDEISFLKNGKSIALTDVNPIVFSEAMRDVDLVASVAQLADDQQLWTEEAASRRQELIAVLIQTLSLKGVSTEGHFAFVHGELASYRIHLGTGAIHIQPGNYLCIVPENSSISDSDELYLPFADTDKRMTEILSKIFLLMHDKNITDESILMQINATREPT